ncbi:MAG: hypothetical protein ACO3A2_11605, partial [Bdellovibrionia bacterium]
SFYQEFCLLKNRVHEALTSNAQIKRKTSTQYSMGFGRSELALRAPCGRTTAGHDVKLAQEAGIRSWEEV